MLRTAINTSGFFFFFLMQMHALVFKGPFSARRIFNTVHVSSLGIYNLILLIALF